MSGDMNYDVVKAEALREAADEMETTASGVRSHWRMTAWSNWLRDRADRLATDTAAPEAEALIGDLSDLTSDQQHAYRMGWAARDRDRLATDTEPETSEPCICGGPGSFTVRIKAGCPRHDPSLEATQKPTDTETLAEVLAAHQPIMLAHNAEATPVACKCGSGWNLDQHRTHAEHIAARIEQARAGETALRERIERWLRTTTWPSGVTADLRAALTTDADQ